MDYNEITSVAIQLRTANHQNSNLFTISVNILNVILSEMEQMLENQTPTSSFHRKQSQSNELVRDLQYLSKYIQNTKRVKIYNHGIIKPDVMIDLSYFQNLQAIELHGIESTILQNYQQLQLGKLLVNKMLVDELFKDGSTWRELKEASLKTCQITIIPQQLINASCLHTLDLSHNNIKNFEELSHLHHLKSLNLSYNKLENVSQLNGAICNRLQNLILTNNFIEDLTNLKNLTNLWLLDLTSNCLLNQHSLCNLSHLATLQFLNLLKNPISYHPNHRRLTIGYLHVNVATMRFVLNNNVLTNSEKLLVGCYYPSRPTTSTPNRVLTDSVNCHVEKIRKIRDVVIADGEEADEDGNKSDGLSCSSLQYSPKLHLETKKQIEDLREKFGESWLNSQSGLFDVLGLESSMVIAGSSPYESDFKTYSNIQEISVKENEIKIKETIENEEYEKETKSDDEDDDKEIEIESEECIYLVNIETDTEPILLLIEGNHLLEKDSIGKEREKWHLDSIINSEIINNNKSVQINFETMRKDKKLRIYNFNDDNEINKFFNCITEKLAKRPKRLNTVKYQCMKCGFKWENEKSGSVLGHLIMKCQKCDSNLVVEDDT